MVRPCETVASASQRDEMPASAAEAMPKASDARLPEPFLSGRSSLNRSVIFTVPCGSERDTMIRCLSDPLTFPSLALPRYPPNGSAGIEHHTNKLSTHIVNSGGFSLLGSWQQMA